MCIHVSPKEQTCKRAHGVVGYHARLAINLREVLGSIPNVSNYFYCFQLQLFAPNFGSVFNIMVVQVEFNSTVS